MGRPSRLAGTDVVERYKAGEGINALARRFGVPSSSVRSHLRTQGLELPRRPPDDRRARLAASDVVERHHAGESISSLARRFGMSRTFIAGYLQDAGARPTPSRRPERVTYPDDLVERYRAGESLSQLATSIGCGHAAVREALRRRGLQPTELRPNSRPDLDPAAIIAAYQAGGSLAELGRRFRCSPSTIRRTLLWAGVPRRPEGGKRGRILDSFPDAADYYRAGHSIAEVARRYYVAWDTAYTWLRDQGLLRRSDAPES